MNHKAFTLIELLAVIVILAVIVMIAIPQVNETIESADKNSLLVSAKNIVRTIEYGIINGTINNGELIFDGTNKPIQTTKKITETGTIIVNNKDISLNLCNTQYCVSKSFNEKEMLVTEKENFVEIKKIEDLIRLSNEVNAGDTKTGKIYVLQNSLDFLNQNSYNNYQTMEFGDVNKNGTVEELMTELTTEYGFPGIGFWEWGGPSEEDFYDYYAPFSGIFDGQNKLITNVHMKNPIIYTSDDIFHDLGFFGAIDESIVKNVTLSGKAESNGGYASLFIANGSGSDIINCHVTGEITGVNPLDMYYVTGLLFGRLNADSSFSEEPIGYTINRMSRVIDCSANGSIINTGNGAGILGSGGWGMQIFNSHSTGTISSNYTNIRSFGGFVADLTMGHIYNSFADVDITVPFAADIQELGGFVSYVGAHLNDNSNLIIRNCYSKGHLTGSREMGGFIGQNGPGSENVGPKYATTKNVYSINTITSNLASPGGVGGLVGAALMNIEDSFFAGDITTISTNTAAGLVIGQKYNASTTFDNTYYKENSIITGTHNTFGSAVTLNNLKTEEWYKNTLHFDDNFQYNDGYYPILYKMDPDTLLPTKTLMPNQELVEIK